MKTPMISLERLPERENLCPMVMKTFSLVSVRDIQYDRSKSLKNAAVAIGFNLSKKETCSNWTSNNLREDQIHHSALDYVVLHYVHVGHTIDWLNYPDGAKWSDMNHVRKRKISQRISHQQSGN
ncbi:hypothetical protein CAEBREN_08127 [Caenorhabditis brenneri]|uniref:3'-5' exonuclease domain-containing protein n=1 Tax=Caenorhabditis brenneri TaxID=135651 RepID=G0PGM5_CAEBE|nr:hypothetical protein CAEBREN_08127 [Caenorhabditis brenneri]